MKEFIHANREQIDQEIYRLFDPEMRFKLVAKFNDQQREQWILNDDLLSDWARREGVQL